MRLITPSKILAAFSLVAALMLLCTQPTPVSHGGGGSEVEVVGYVYFSDDCPAPSTQVKLIPRDYDASDAGVNGDLMIDTSNARGCYTFRGVAPGTYNVQAVQLTQRTRMLVTGLEVAGDSTTVPSAVLSKPGTVRLLLPESVVGGGSIIITGTDIAVSVKNGSSDIIIDSVPVGILPEIRYVVNDSAAVTRQDVAVTSSDTTTIVNPAWNYQQWIGLNTAASGAGVGDDVNGFPVLIRLNSETFDFSQAGAAGEDIRFTTTQGASLPYEIELWDAAAGRAAVWVKVDTLFGNDSTQSITMYWGNPAAADLSTGAAVFDTANGFQGVWHLSGGADGAVRDATVNGYDGTSPDTARPQSAPGVVGGSCVFDGVTDYITMPNTADSKLNFPVEGTYTVSAWVSIDTLDGLPHLIVAKGYEQYFLRCTYFPTNAPLWEFSEFGNTEIWGACTTTAKGRQWTLLTGVRLGNRQLFYCNGVLVDSTPNTYQAVGLSRDTSTDLTIGKFLEKINVPNTADSYCFFKGAIDEVRILGSAQSSDWVRLCYMNQRSDDRLVVFK